MSRLAETNWVRRIVGRFAPDSGIGHSPNRTSKPIPIDPDITRLLASALFYQIHGEDEDARSHYIDAATRARARYETIPTVGMTASDRLTRGVHGEIAVTAFVSAREFDDARGFAATFLADPLAPEASRARVAKTLEILGPQQ